MADNVDVGLSKWKDNGLAELSAVGNVAFELEGVSTRARTVR